MRRISDFLENLSTLKAIHSIFFFGLLVYANSLFNNFVWDAKDYLINNGDVHQFNIPLAFKENFFNNSGQYRPLVVVYFSFLYGIFSHIPFFYHVVQVALHMVNAMLLFLLYKKFISKVLSLFLTLIFLIHPVQIESVTYISAAGSVLYFLCGIVALHLALKEKSTIKHQVLIYSLLLASMLIKESGIIFLFLVLLYQFISKKSNFFKTLPVSILTLCMYFFFRFVIGNVYFDSRPLIPIASLSLFERVLTIPAVMYYYIKIFFFPLHMAINQHWVVKEITFPSFYFPLAIDVFFFSTIAIFGMYLYKKKQRTISNIFLFFCSWFIGSFLIHSQFIPLDATVADRWFYTDMAGLLGIIGVILQYLSRQKITYSKRFLFISAVCILSLLVTRTIIRSNDWQNPIKLYIHDMKGNENFLLEELLGEELTNQGRYTEAIVYYKKSIDRFPTDLSYYNLGYTYELMNDIPKAKQMYIKAHQTKNYIPWEHQHYVTIYQRLGNILVYYDNPTEAKKFLLTALQDYPDDPHLWVLLAIAEYKRNNHSAALTAAQRAHQLSPHRPLIQYVYEKLLNKESLIVEYNPNKE